MALTYEPISSTTLTSAASSVTFSSISGTYTDLILIVSGSMATSATGTDLQFNSDTGNNYSNTYLAGDGSSALSGRGTNNPATIVGYLGTGQGNNIFHIMNYSNSTTYKTVLGRSSAPANYTIARVGLWRNTAAITSVTVKSDDNTNFSTGSTFTLYGIKSA